MISNKFSGFVALRYNFGIYTVFKYNILNLAFFTASEAKSRRFFTFLNLLC